MEAFLLYFRARQNQQKGPTYHKMEGFYTFLTEQYILPLYLIVWIVSVARYRSYFDTPLKYYPIYLMYTFLTEVLGYLIAHHEDFQFFSEEEYNWHNVIIFNIYSVISSQFFYYIYWKVLKIEKHRNWVKYGAVISLLGFVVSLFFQDPFHMNLYFADLLASTILVFAIVLYFKEKGNETSSYPWKHNLMFWMSLGMLVFYAIFPFLFLIAYEIPKIWTEYRLRDVLKVLIVIMYGSFMIGVIFGKRKAFR